MSSQNQRKIEVLVALDSGGWNTTTNRMLVHYLARNENLHVTAFISKKHPRRMELSEDIVLLEDEKFPGNSPKELLNYPPERLQHFDFLMMHCYSHELQKQAKEICKATKLKWIPIVHMDWGSYLKFFEEAGVFLVGRDPDHKAEGQRQIEMCKSVDLVVTIGPTVAQLFTKLQPYVISIAPGIFSELRNIRQVRQDKKTFNVLIITTHPHLSPSFYVQGCDIAVKAILSLEEEEVEQMSYHLIFVMSSVHSVSDVEKILIREGMKPNQFTVKSAREVDSPENLAEFITDADVLILPSRLEGFGMSSIYAISANLPLLVSEHSGVGTALKKLPCGGIHVVGSDDPKIWGQKIKEVRTIGQEIAFKRAIQLRKEYGEEYGWDDQCTKLVEKMMMKIGTQ